MINCYNTYRFAKNGKGHTAIYQFIKRDGIIVDFDIEKIAAAIKAAFESESYDDSFTRDELENYHKYIRIMAELDWPAYINGDPDFHKEIINSYETEGSPSVESAIFDYYGALYLKGLEDQLAESKVIKQERLPLFHEALLLYQLGYYYGAVAILTTQLIGITADIERFLKANHASYNPQTLELIKKRYRLTNTNDTSRVMTAVVEGMTIDDDENKYGFLLGYLRFKIFHNHMPKSETEKHVNRNMLCHGSQLNYGTREHALKVILCIDALAWIAEVISDNVLNSHSEQDT